MPEISLADRVAGSPALVRRRRAAQLLVRLPGRVDIRRLDLVPLPGRWSWP